MEKTIFNWGSWDIVDTMIFNFMEIEFIRDFGLFKKGQRFDTITLNYSEGRLEIYDEKGNIIMQQGFRFEAT